MLRSIRGRLSVPDPGALCSTALLLAMPLPLLDPSMPSSQGTVHQSAPAITRLQPAPPSQSAAAPQTRRTYALTPERRALLNTIRFAEGTWKGGSASGYRTLYGGAEFNSLERHPRTVVIRRYRSAAAGAYQFLPQTWDEVSSQLRLNDFSPSSQDQAALHLVERRGALTEVDRQGLSRSVMARLAREWASFPSANGASAYGQPVKRPEELQRFYRTNLEEQRQGTA
ncbi:MAG: glycoside hydrolase family 104 protein [Cyanobacteriota bacterium]|nr:glycoside hydrolase family 104 protein [Cyanobacteriota bacterium]